MSDFLGDAREVLSKVKAAQVSRLLSIVLETRFRKVQFIEQRYAEGAQNFRETLQFLCDLGWISAREDELDIVPSVATVTGWLQNEESIRKAILTALIGQSCPYRHAVAGYVNNFIIGGTELKHRPSLSERVRQRPLRDLLMDLRTVSYRPSDETYVLEDSAAPIYIWATNFVRPKNRQTHEALQRRQEELGFAAELVVIDIERRRLRHDLAHLIEHVSQSNPYSCYDIKSATVLEREVVDRYIEVKAVSLDTYQFYWTKSEVDAAKLLRDRYFLYLLPYETNRGFKVDALMMINDPHRTLDNEKWEIEENVLVCRRKQVGQAD